VRTSCAGIAALAAVALAGWLAPVAPAATHPRPQRASAVLHPRPHRPRAERTGPTLPISHAGRWLTDAEGRVVIVHGTNLVYKLDPFYPAASGFGPPDAAFLKSIGFNAVRVGVLWQGVEPAPGVFDPTYIDHVAATVRALAREGIVSLLDFHQDLINQEFGGEGFPSWAVQTGGLPNVNLGFDENQEVDPALQNAYDAFWNDAAGPDGIGLQSDYAGAWAAVAAHFATSRSVLGDDLFNEPFPGKLWEDCLTTLGCPGFDRQLTGFYNLVANRIRTVDPHTLLFYEPASLFNEGVNSTIGTVAGADVGFAFHDYCLSAGTNAACDGENDLVFSHALARVRTTGQALLESEFGASDDTDYLEGEVAQADANMVPWLEWAYCACGDPTTVDSSEGIVVNPAKPLSGANLITPTLSALVEPYPQVIAGTPLSYGYDHATHTFAFTYATTRAGTGADFPAGSQTDVATPTMDYPDGYRVQASGARVTSAPDAGTLTLAANPGAREVAITVTPG
jgi:endoglycosylceramidase